MINTQRYMQLTNNSKGLLILNPIMTGGILPQEVRRRLYEDEWCRVGYSICFECLKGRSDLIGDPPIREFLQDVAEFYGGEVAEHTFGCRTAQFAVMKTVSEYIDGGGSREYSKVVVADPLCHYTTAIAAEMNGLKVVEPPHGGPPEYKVKPEGFIERIEEVKRETGKLPGLIAVTHVDPYYGNLNPVVEVGAIAENYSIPYMVNAAYTAGVMPLDMREFKADFLTVSAHKSMASLGPLGFLVTRNEWSQRAFRTSTSVTSWSKRSFTKKLINLFGCSVGGAPLISALLSFPYVVERVKGWDGEVERACWFIEEMERLDSVRLMGERPHRHHLLCFDTPVFYEISKYHKRRGFFLAEDMRQRGITGLHRGISKHIKLSTYGLNWDQLKQVRDAFVEIADKYVKEYQLRYEASI
ncbi:MAG: O-phospho-L-seryl-tRNA:Cys-tRNA synthase [Candidatus Bathyarchaeia archaeon]